MSEIIKNIFICLGISCVVVFFSTVLESQFIFEFLQQSLIIILISLLAINTTTSSIIMTKLKEISDETGASFTHTIKELHISIKEQVWLIVVGIFFLILNDSILIKEYLPILKFALNTVLFTIFVYAILILKDTANAIFIVLDYEDRTK